MLEFFEAVINMIPLHAPQAAIAFNTDGGTSLEAARRALARRLCLSQARGRCDSSEWIRQLGGMSTAIATGVSVRENLRSGSLAEFEEIYRSNVGLVAAYFARRCWEPQEVADLTSETIVRAAGSFDAFDPRRGSARAWLFGIAAHVWAGYCEQVAHSRDAIGRLAGYRALKTTEMRKEYCVDE